MKIVKYSSTKWLVLSVVIILFLMIGVCLVGQATMSGMTDALSAMTQWTQRHHDLFIVWHMIIIISIYVLWGKKIHTLKNKGEVNEKQAKILLKFRYILMAFVLFVDVSVHGFF